MCPRPIGLWAALLTLVASIPTISGVVHAQATAGQIKLLFLDDQDVADVWGKLPPRARASSRDAGLTIWRSPTTADGSSA